MDDTQELKGKILRLGNQVNFDGKSWKWFSERLNEEGLTTLSGKPFTPRNLQRFCSRNEIDFRQPRKELDWDKDAHGSGQEKTAATTISHGRSRKPPTEVDKPDESASYSLPQLPRWLVDDLDNLKALLDWWKSLPESTPATPEARPTFTGEYKNTGIRINKTILQRALAQSKQQRYQTGGNLSQLVEFLLWRYIGSPEDVLDRSQ